MAPNSISSDAGPSGSCPQSRSSMTKFEGKSGDRSEEENQKFDNFASIIELFKLSTTKDLNDRKQV